MTICPSPAADLLLEHRVLRARSRLCVISSGSSWFSLFMLFVTQKAGSWWGQNINRKYKQVCLLLNGFRIF